MKKFVTRQILCLALVSCYLSAIPMYALAWGTEGHRIVARIAQNNLSPKARQGVHRLLRQGETLIGGTDTRHVPLVGFSTEPLNAPMP